MGGHGDDWRVGDAGTLAGRGSPTSLRARPSPASARPSGPHRSVRAGAGPPLHGRCWRSERCGPGVREALSPAPGSQHCPPPAAPGSLCSRAVGTDSRSERRSRSRWVCCGLSGRGRSNWAVKWKVLPWPISLSTQMRPFISSTSRRQMARPRPVPPYLRVVDPSACRNASKISFLLLTRNADAGVDHPGSGAPVAATPVPVPRSLAPTPAA